MTAGNANKIQLLNNIVMHALTEQFKASYPDRNTQNRLINHNAQNPIVLNKIMLAADNLLV